MMDSRDYRELAKAVSTYLLNTTELRPQPSVHAVWAVVNGAFIMSVQPLHNPDAEILAISTGSVAELYIEPLARCFGDYDTMYCFSDMIAVPRCHPLPRRLPPEFSDNVSVYEIIDSHIPGYVYLVLRYQLSRRDDASYSWSMYEDNELAYTFLLNSDNLKEYAHGPARVNANANTVTVITGHSHEPDTYIMSLDWVFSVRCLAWPPQAAHWPRRARPHGCPDANTVELVVADGCHLVPVAHRLCRDDDCVGNRQYRLSFSTAELRLINNWTPLQQLVYHVMRSVLKIAGITTESETAVVSNYHVKTTMMWAAEVHPAVWWNTGSSCLIIAAARLLDTLASCLARRYCQHYFVDDANLFMLTAEQCRHVDSVITKLQSVSDVDQLATIMLDKYIKPCVFQVCPSDVVELFYDDRNIDEAFSAVAAWRCSSLREKSWRTIDSCSHSIERCVSETSLTVTSCRHFMQRFHDVECRLVVHFVGVAYLHVAYRLATGNTYKLQHRDQLLDVLSVIFCSPGDVSTWQRRSPTPITKAGVLLKAVAHTWFDKGSVDRLVRVELSKAYLYREISDSNSSDAFRLANVYLAAIYCEQEVYEMAIDHCKLAQAAEVQEQSDCPVHAELIPQIDDVDAVLGIAVLYQFVRASALSRRQHGPSFGILSTHLFANFLHVFCLSRRPESDKKQSALSGQLQRYRRSLLNCKQPLVSDVMLFKLTTTKLRVNPGFQPNTDQCSPSLPTWNGSKLVNLLTQLAVERMTTFREIQTRDFGGDIVPGTADFLAMYAFRRGFYVECMRLCQNNIENFADYDLLQEIFMIPEFIFLMGDCDLVSVIGLALLISPTARVDHRYQFVFRLSQLSLALYLYTECQLRLRHSVQSLKETLRCADAASRRHPPHAMLNTLTLQLIRRKIASRIRESST